MLKQLLFLVLAGSGLTQMCAAASCVSGTLSSYIGLGSAGCSVGTSNLFNFRLVPGTTGAQTIAPGSVTLSPFIGLNPGLTSAVNVSSSAFNVQEVLFGFQVSGASYVGTSLTLSGSSETGDGAVTGLANFCAGGSFGSDGLSGCPGVTNGLVTVDGAQNQDMAAFAAVSLLSITNDLTIDGGLAGSARGGTLLNQFTTAATVPEPMSILLTGIGLALAIGTRSKFKRK